MTVPVSPNVVGLDLSLTGTGVAHPGGGSSTIRTKLTGAARLGYLRDLIGQWLSDERTDLVAVEGYAFGRTNKAHQMGELGGVVRLMLHERGQPWCEIPPSSMKKYATGKGNAGKSEVLVAAVRRLGYDGADDNQADALWLRAMALDHLGAPCVQVPASHRDALVKVQWPAIDLDGAR